MLESAVDDDDGRLLLPWHDEYGDDDKVRDGIVGWNDWMVGRRRAITAG